LFAEFLYAQFLSLSQLGAVVFRVTLLPVEPPRAFIFASASGLEKASSLPVMTNSIPDRGISSDSVAVLGSIPDDKLHT